MIISTIKNVERKSTARAHARVQRLPRARYIPRDVSRKLHLTLRSSYRESVSLQDGALGYGLVLHEQSHIIAHSQGLTNGFSDRNYTVLTIFLFYVQNKYNYNMNIKKKLK